MRSVIISSALLLATVIGVVCNLRYTDKSMTEMIELTESLPTSEEGFSECYDEVKVIAARWEKKRSAVTYLMDYREVDEADMACKKLYNSVRGEDFSAYLTSRDEFIHALNRLRDISMITAENIL